MKIKYSILTIFFTWVLLLTSCEEYLERTPASNISEESVFRTYYGFQGYVDGFYNYLIPYMFRDVTATMDIGDDVYGNRNFQIAQAIPKGNYWYTWTNEQRNPFRTRVHSSGVDIGIFEGGWECIHMVNLGLKNLDLLISVSDEEKNLLLGQMYFFRAWCHFEIARAWGGIPYIDVLLEPDDNMKLPRLSLEETFLKIAADFDRASKYLPWDWDETVQGQAATGKNYGRITKGIALAMKARTFLYAASPWIEGLKNGTENKYNLALCDSAARAALEVINSNRYELVPWNEYHQNFARNDNNGSNFIWTKEIIFSNTREVQAMGLATINTGVGRVHLSMRTVKGTGANGIVVSPTLNFINLYETANGLAIKDDPAYDEANPWVNRDPRFLKTILIDGVKWSSKTPPMTIELFSEGGAGGKAGLDMTPNTTGSLSGFLIRKYTCYGVNGDDKNWNNYRLVVPYIRLPEMYLTYAEAVNEIGGPNGTIPGSSLTALEAVNIIRRRVKLPVNEDITLPFELQTYGNESLPDVHELYRNSKELLRERIHNERSIELSYEGHRWFDIRRWYVAHGPDYKQSLGLAFSKDHTSFRPFEIDKRLFENPKHYFFPFNPEHIYLYKDFKQNPGWE